MTITVRSGASPTVNSAATLKTASAIETPTDPFHDSELVEATGVTAWNDYLLTPQNLSESLTFENSTPDICSVASNGAVTRVSSGHGIIYTSNGSVSRKKVVLNMVNQTGATVTEFAGYVEDSISDLCAAEALAMLSAGGDLNYYSAVNHSSATYTRNLDCWLPADMSAVSCANRDAGGAWGHQRAGTLIAADVVVFANHYPVPVGGQLRFANAAGTVFTKTVVAHSTAVSSGDNILADRLLGRLDSAVDESITPMKVAGSWVMQDPLTVGTTRSTYYMGGLAVWLDQLKNAYATHVGSRTELVTSNRLTGTFEGDEYTDIRTEGYTEFIQGQQSSPYLEDFPTFTKYPIEGDSGSAVCVILNDEPVLLWTWLSAISGTPVYNSETLLNAQIASTGSVETVTVAPDPTS